MTGRTTVTLAGVGAGYQAIRPRWLERVVFGWSNVLVVWIMQARDVGGGTLHQRHDLQAGRDRGPHTGLVRRGERLAARVQRGGLRKGQAPPSDCVTITITVR